MEDKILNYSFKTGGSHGNDNDIHYKSLLISRNIEGVITAKISVLMGDFSFSKIFVEDNATLFLYKLELLNRSRLKTKTQNLMDVGFVSLSINEQEIHNPNSVGLVEMSIGYIDYLLKSNFSKKIIRVYMEDKKHHIFNILGNKNDDQQLKQIDDILKAKDVDFNVDNYNVNNFQE